MDTSASSPPRAIIIGKASRPKWREQRLAILMEVINDEPTKKWSVRDMAQAMRQHPVVASIQPHYGKTTAHRDWLAIRDELKERRDELASDYIQSQLDITDEALGDLQREYDNLNKIDISLIDDEEMRASIILNRIKAKKELIVAMDRMMSRQQTLVPVTVPKKLEVDERRVEMNLDTFLKMRERALALKDGDESNNVIEGELI